ncbi:MAG TPA: Gfo/Idh/MocA family oxidoreductase [Sedimentisphaerales bacterium]|nr:Gfo/Idh/MocA family oxidoreductase [Sedimentisphaerales bacterium]
MKRREFLKASIAVGAAASLTPGRVLGANDDIRIGVIGIGSFVKIGGKGRGDIRDFRKIQGVRVAALCDCDQKHLDYEVNEFSKRSEKVKACRDFREILDDKDIDAVSITTPNHWHSLMTIMACQAGKDVFVQKPSSHNIFEGRKMVEAMRKYKRVVQAVHGPRESGAIAESLEYARAGNLGKIKCIYGINYRSRTSIGKVSGPQPIPPSCDYDLWCGPAPKKPLMREQLHYDWHWDWDTGDGDLGNMGIHAMDGCRWALRQSALPKRVISIGERLGYDDDGQTPNTMITLLDYEPAPIIFEVRGLPKDASLRESDWGKNGRRNMDEFRGVQTGFVVLCEGGYVADGSAFDNQGTLIKKFTREQPGCKQNFIDVVRSRKTSELRTDAMEGHLSCGLVHLANISYRVGRHKSNGEILDVIRGEAELCESFARLNEHLAANRLNLDRKSLTLGAMLTMDTDKERFVGPMGEEANMLLSRNYREPFVVRDTV